MTAAIREDRTRQPPPADDLFSELVTGPQLTAENPSLFPSGRLKWWVRHRHHNGAAEAGAILVIQRRAFFHRQKMKAWLLEQDKSA
jgi:hypothetical protein